ncbi:recombinase family protein [Streptomyces sp. YIM 98790]|uniref:recombinase family protein n=1 Tax=Streptomyces sp. YIM 98790 TaxID=2689077 RepID=UPI001407F5E6|nr:recombinase family protein [Streptomyces sp. YIM 98790]
MNNTPRSTADQDNAAIYCRISKADDNDQTGVDRQERICREIADRLGVRVVAVFKDNNRSAWQRNRKRKGWDELLERTRRGEFRHVIVYHPDRLMRQPRDLEELLSAAEDQHVTLHGQANRRDLSNAEDRFILRIEVAQACKSSDDTSRRVNEAVKDRLAARRPHAGRRHYGYTPQRTAIVEHEAEIIKEIYRRYLDGETPPAIARDLHERGIRTAEGKQWQASTVRNMLDSAFLAGVQMHRGKRLGMGDWPTIIDLGQWEEVQQLRQFRSVQEKERTRPKRYYLLRGVVTCTCGTRMGGSKSGGKRDDYIYRCARSARNGEQRCKRTILAEPLEKLITELAVRQLESLDVTGRPAAPVQVPQSAAEDEADQQQLAELKEMWLAREIPTPEYRQMRRTIEDRIKARQKVTAHRPVSVLKGLTGPGAAKAWAELEKAGDYPRLNAVLRFLYAAVIIHPTQRRGPGLDLDRIDVEPNPLP